jgi:hypothetical protein
MPASDVIKAGFNLPGIYRIAIFMQRIVVLLIMHKSSIEYE